MKLTEISKARLKSQKIADTEYKSAKEIVKWMGAMQAQDYSMSKWAIGIRLIDPSVAEIESSIDKGEIIRIHVLRPTWHFVAAEDTHWMIKLSAAKIKSSLKSRHKQLELTEQMITKTNTLIEKALAKRINLTREELADEFHKVKIKTDENRLSHLLFCAELEGIICSGPAKSNKQTYSLLSERVPHNKDLNRDESLAELARRYFTSHCPATIQDFAWWANLSLTEIRKTVDFIKDEFTIETIGSGEFLYPDSFSGSQLKNSVFLLPAFDEFLISYKDRSSSLSLVHNKKTVSDNGIFYPPILVNGQVAGLWKRTIIKNKVTVEADFFEEPGKTTKSLVKNKAGKFGNFLNKETELIYKEDVSKP